MCEWNRKRTYVKYLFLSEIGNFKLSNKIFSNAFIFTADTKCNPRLSNNTGVGDASSVHFYSDGIVGLIVWMACVLYSSLRTASSSSKIMGDGNILDAENRAGIKQILSAPKLFFGIYRVIVWRPFSLCVVQKSRISTNAA